MKIKDALLLIAFIVFPVVAAVVTYLFLNPGATFWERAVAFAASVVAASITFGVEMFILMVKE